MNYYLQLSFNYKKVNNSFFIINQKKGTIITLNEVSFFLWDILKKKLRHEDLVELLLQEYAVEHVVAEQDVEEFLKTALNSGIIEKVK